MNKEDMRDKKARKQLRLTTAQFRNPDRPTHMQISFRYTGYNTGKPMTAIQIQGLLDRGSYSLHRGELLPTSLSPLHCRPPRRVLPVEDGHPCYVDTD